MKNELPQLGPCSCRRGIERDNCPNCEGSGQRIDWRAFHASPVAVVAPEVADAFGLRELPIVHTGRVVCAVCGEESGGRGTSFWGSVHKYGPTTHHFRARMV